MNSKWNFKILLQSLLGLRSITLFVCLLSLSPLSNCFAQIDSSLWIVKALNIPKLERGISVYYSPGYKERAQQIQSYMEDAMNFYQKKLNVTVDLNIAVLNKEHWTKVTKVPFDVPNVSGVPHVVFLPANFGEGVVTADWSKGMQQLKPEIIQKIKLTGYSYEQIGVKQVDNIGLHELGHVIAYKLGIASPDGIPNKWYSEFLATYLANSFLQERDPEYMKIARLLTDHKLEIMPKPKYTSLEDFERLYFGVGPQNYEWYQIKFAQLVERIYNTKGLGFIEELITSSFTRNEKIPVDVLLQHLERINPGFVTWSKESR